MLTSHLFLVKRNRTTYDHDPTDECMLYYQSLESGKEFEVHLRRLIYSNGKATASVGRRCFIGGPRKILIAALLKACSHCRSSSPSKARPVTSVAYSFLSHYQMPFSSVEVGEMHLPPGDSQTPKHYGSSGKEVIS